MNIVFFLLLLTRPPDPVWALRTFSERLHLATRARLAAPRPANATVREYKTLTITQLLDHFNFATDKTFEQRYLAFWFFFLT